MAENARILTWPWWRVSLAHYIEHDNQIDCVWCIEFDGFLKSNAPVLQKQLEEGREMREKLEAEKERWYK